MQSKLTAKRLVGTLWLILSHNGALIFFCLVLTGSLSLNVVLGWRVRAMTHVTRRAGIQPGTKLPPIPVLDKSGNRTTINFTNDRPTILYVLSPKCHWCARNEDNIRTLATALSTQYRFIGLSITDVAFREFVDSRNFPFPVLALASQDLTRSLDLGVTPQTAVFSEQGAVSKVWVGAFDQDRQHEIEQFFKVRLPGLKPEQLQ